MEPTKTPRLILTLGLALILCGPAQAAKRKPAAKGGKTRSAAQGKARRLIDEGIISLKRQQFSGAVDLFQKAAKADTGSAEAFYYLGDAYYQRAFQRGTPDKADGEDAAAAADAYRTALALDPSLKTIPQPFLLYHGLAQCQEALGRYEEAAGNLKLAMKLSPVNPMPALYAAELRYRMKDLKRSAENLRLSVQRARRINAYPSLAKLIRSHPQFSSLLRVSQNQAILSLYDQVAAGTLTEDQAKEQIEERSSYRDSLRDSIRDPSLESRQRIIESPLVDPKVYERLGKAHEDFKYRDFRAAIIGYQAALQEDRDKGSLDAVQKSIIYERIGTSYRQLGLTAEAIRSLERSAVEQPETSSAYYQMALAYSTAGQFNRALGALEQALKNSRSTTDLRKLVLMAKTDLELEPVRDLPAFARALLPYAGRLQARGSLP